MITVKRKDSSVEIRDLDDLHRVLLEARSQGEPLVLQTDGGDEIVFSPSARTRPKRRTSEERAKADDEAFLASAGSWKGLIDVDEFKRNYKAARGSNRPPIVLDLPEG